MSRRTAAFGLSALCALGLLVVLSRVMTDDSTTRRSEPTPAARPTCEIDPGIDGEVAITAAIEGCRDGSTVLFPAGRRYTQANRILVKDRRDLVIDGNGSTFTTTFVGKTNTINGNWLILRGHDITLKNMHSVGTFDYTGERSLGRISPDPDFSEANPSYGLYGVDTVHLIDVTAYGPWGDGVTTGPDEYVDGSTPDYTRNVFIKRMHVEKTARMCWGPTSGTNIWVEDSTCKDAWYGGLDAEIDNPNQPLVGLHVLRNTFDGFNTLGVFVPVAAANVMTGDIEIRDNVFLTANDKQCSAPIHVGGYAESNPALFHNVVVEGNTLLHYGPGIVLDHVVGGSAKGNTLTRLHVDGFTPVGLCGPGADEAIRVTNSSNVTVDGNVIR